MKYENFSYGMRFSHMNICFSPEIGNSEGRFFAVLALENTGHELKKYGLGIRYESYKENSPLC